MHPASEAAQEQQKQKCRGGVLKVLEGVLKVLADAVVLTSAPWRSLREAQLLPSVSGIFGLQGTNGFSLPHLW